MTVLRIVPTSLAALAVGLVAAAPPAARADRYDDGVAEATRLDQAGEAAAAADRLAGLLADYPEDMSLLLQTAWAEFRAVRTAEAEGHYRAALSISAESLPARLGLAWSLQRLDRCVEALPHFLGVLARSPGDASAAEGRALCAPKPWWHLYPAVSLGKQQLQLSTTGEWGANVAPSLRGLLFDHLLLGAAYRYVGVPSASPLLRSLPQHEAYFELGATWPLFGLSLHYALLDDQVPSSGVSHHAGLTARYSPWGDGTLDLAASAYSDATIVRVEQAWRLPLPAGFSLRPAAAVQLASTTKSGDGALANGALTLAWDREHVGLWLHGNYGEQLRPAYLSRDAVMNLSDRIAGGISAGGRVSFAGLNLTAAFEYDRLRSADGSGGQSNDAYFLSTGLSASF